jgi:threonine aldolase
VIDLRSDLCTVPTEEMWDAMRAAELGWATVGEDRSVNELCARAAELLGKDDAVWVPTCGMANLVALLTFCEPGDAVVLESSSHVLTSEAMGIVDIARLEPRSLYAADGRLAREPSTSCSPRHALRSSFSRTPTPGPGAPSSRSRRRGPSSTSRSATTAASTSTAPGS